MNRMAYKIILIIIGCILLAIGLIITFGIIIYICKEKDNYGFFSFLITLPLITLGVFSLVKGIKLK